MTTVRRKLALNRGVVPFRIEFSQDPEKTIQVALKKLKAGGDVGSGDKLVVVSDVPTATGTVTSIQVRVFD
jgi:pyruvate kinase